MEVITSFAFALVVILPLWRIFERAGLQPAMALVVFIPVVGIFIAALVLAFSDWPALRARYGAGGSQPDLFDGRR